jgi:hypothetical protein
MTIVEHFCDRCRSKTEARAAYELKAASASLRASAPQELELCEPCLRALLTEWLATSEPPK